MDFTWLPLDAALAGLCVGLIIGHVRRRAALAALRETEARAAKSAERATTAERELAAERERLAHLTDGRPHPLAAVARGRLEIAEAHDPAAVATALAAALDRLFEPSQVMVFLVADEFGREFVLAATSGRGAAAWPLGARLSDTTGRLGLVARRGVVMDEREFGAEPPIVREQIEATEPAGFRVEIGAPLVVDGAVAAVVSVGGSTLPFDATRGGLELLTTHAAAALRAIERRECAPAAPR